MAALLALYACGHALLAPYAPFRRDEGINLFWAFDILRDPDLRLLTVPLGISTKGVPHGCMAGWAHAAALAIHPSPYSPLVLIAVANLAVHALLIDVGRTLGHRRAAYAASAFFFVAPLYSVMLVYRMWSCAYVVLFSTGVLWSLTKLVKTRDSRFLFALAASFGLALQSHPVTILWAPCICLAFLATPLTCSTTRHLLAVATFFLAAVPYVVFAWLLGPLAFAGLVAMALLIASARWIKERLGAARAGHLASGLYVAVMVVAVVRAVHVAVTRWEALALVLGRWVELVNPWSPGLADGLGVAPPPIDTTLLSFELVPLFAFLVLGAVRWRDLDVGRRVLHMSCVLPLAGFVAFATLDRVPHRWMMWCLPMLFIAMMAGLRLLVSRAYVAGVAAAVLLFASAATSFGLSNAIVRTRGTAGGRGPTLEAQWTAIEGAMARDPGAYVLWVNHDGVMSHMLFLKGLALAAHEPSPVEWMARLRRESGAPDWMWLERTIRTSRRPLVHLQHMGGLGYRPGVPDRTAHVTYYMAPFDEEGEQLRRTLASLCVAPCRVRPVSAHGVTLFRATHYFRALGEAN